MSVPSPSTSQRSVSVIIPAYNSEALVARSIESALAQHYPPAEVIVIDDGSTDRTAEIARAFGSRIMFLQQENLGQGAARNAGLRVATGDFIAFLDADDYWLPGFLGACVDFLTVHEEAIAVSTGIIVRLWGKPERRWPPAIASDGTPFEAGVLENFFDFWGRHDHVRTGSVLIRRSIIDQAGFQRPDLRISQDLEYWSYLATWGQWGFIPEPLWIGDATPSAALQGWMKKYYKRRALCPSIEQWESRVISRLRPEHREGFERVRGRVAANFALSKIKSGTCGDAWQIVERYGPAMPSNWSSLLMRLGNRAGGPGRAFASAVIRAREHYKSYSIGRSVQRKPSKPPMLGEVLPAAISEVKQ